MSRCINHAANIICRGSGGRRAHPAGSARGGARSHARERTCRVSSGEREGQRPLPSKHIQKDCYMDESIRHALVHGLTCDITTTGRTSGKPRRIEIWYVLIDGQVYITGTPGPRDWYANLLAQPRFVFHIK